MRFYTIEKDNKEQVAVEIENGKLALLESLGITVCDMNELIRKYEELENAIKGACKAPAAESLDLAECRILAPIPVPVGDVLCLGVNYREHIEETVHITDFTKKKDAVYFSKHANRCNDPDGVIPAYEFVDCLDYEVELGVVLKKDVLSVSREEAHDAIFGYTIVNDVSARNLQFKHQQWFRGKSLDGYLPMGPCIVTKEEIPDAYDLDLFCYVNEEERQHSNTSKMITSIEEAISELSQGMTLKAGTIIATGTPGGVAMGMKNPVYLKKGDKVRCVIKGIGELINTVGEK